ncbi:hypothetical protein [Thiocystis violacea]|uniref:hypothetical protein n=1 Tax=Thiocystis violacea TaxID=13725 RepID=UPI0019089659|nr:hypothetical protein [Thiocystis violacea]MBK1721825.1 hypothetical protein [Thiocystis violacea]
MYTLMRSEPLAGQDAATRSRAFEQQEVADFSDLEEAMAACDAANRERQARHYVMDPSGRELYQGAWID